MILSRSRQGSFSLPKIDDFVNERGDWEELRHVATAKVVLADYDLLEQDFPDALQYIEKFGSGKSKKEQWNSWLISHAAYVSTQQAKQTLVNSPVKLAQDSKPAFRPPRYGRAAVVEVIEEDRQLGLFDLKGIGVAPNMHPSDKVHSNGLEYLGTALCDYVTGLIIDEIFRLSNPGLRTLPTYAIIDLGFDITGGWFGTAPAGIHVRQAHLRPVNGAELPTSGSDEERMKLNIELLLRKYGIYSSKLSPYVFERHGDKIDLTICGTTQQLNAVTNEIANKVLGKENYLELEGINLQLTRGTSWSGNSATLLDFGHFRVSDKFDAPLLSLVSDRSLRIGGIVWPSSNAFIQPDKRVRLDPLIWDRWPLNEVFFQAASQLGDNQIDNSNVSNIVDRLLSSQKSKWSGTN